MCCYQSCPVSPSITADTSLLRTANSSSPVALHLSEMFKRNQGNSLWLTANMKCETEYCVSLPTVPACPDEFVRKRFSRIFGGLSILAETLVCPLSNQSHYFQGLRYFLSVLQSVLSVLQSVFATSAVVQLSERL